jgi:hypothetical protein
MPWNEDLMQRPTKFEIKGLFGNRNVSLRIEGDALVLVGPNGIGKSSVINIFYFFISRQWDRLIEYDFREVAIWFGKEELRALRSDISGLSDFGKLMSDLPPRSRTGIMLEKLKDANLLEGFLSTQRINLTQRDRMAEVLGTPPDEVRLFRSHVLRRYETRDNDLFHQPRITIEKELSKRFPDRTLYLPTYRRIEKDLREIFPGFEERLRSQMPSENLAKFTRSSTHYVDLVSFGMEDVRSNIEAKTRLLRDYSLGQYNDLSAIYLRDVIKGFLAVWSG